MNRVVAGAVAGLAMGAFSMASAIDLGVGGGAFFASDFGGGVVGLKMAATIPGAGAVEAEDRTPWLGGGLNGFFDLTYAEVGVGFAVNTVDPKSKIKLNGQEQSVEGSNGSMMNLGLSLLGKYPIDLGGVVLAPAVGIDYTICVATELSVVNPVTGQATLVDESDASALWIKFGALADFNVSDKLFLRAGALYGIRLENKLEKDLTDSYDVLLKALGVDADIEPIMGHGLTVRFGVGFRL